MNNRYLYKAKRIDNGEWVEGSLVSTPKADEEFKAIIIPLDDNGEYTEGIDDKCLGFEFWYKVDENTLCQCTGLKDKNGKLIWENDIVRKVDTNALGYHRERICTVSYEKSGYWNIITTLGDGYWIGEFEKEQLEVIGNKFDNPELLEVEV